MPVPLAAMKTFPPTIGSYKNQKFDCFVNVLLENCSSVSSEAVDYQQSPKIKINVTQSQAAIILTNLLLL